MKEKNNEAYYFNYPRQKELKSRMKAIAREKGFDLKSISIIAIEEFLKRNERK